MKTVKMKRFGSFLLNREDGQMAYAVLVRDQFSDAAKESVFFDFEGVKVLAPSFCDEVFGRLAEEFPDRTWIDTRIHHGLRAAFETVAETRGVTFQYRSPS